MTNIHEDLDSAFNVEKGSISVDNDAVIDTINSYLSRVTSKSYITPYIAMENVRKVLTYYKIFIPQNVFLEDDEGHEVFEVNQFGDKFGIDNEGVVKEKHSDDLFIYFEWSMNENGLFDTFCEIVDEEELDEIMADIEEESEEDEGEEEDDNDGAEASHDVYKASNMKEDYDFRSKQDAEDSAAIAKRARKPSEKSFWKKAYKKNSKKAVTGMDEESINELKMDKKTYVSAMQRTTGYDADYSGEEGRVDRDKLIARAKKYKGEKFAKQLAGADQMTSRPNRNVVPGQWGSDQLSWRKPSRKTKSGKANKQDLAALKASMKKGDYRKPSFKKRKLPEETQLGSHNVARMKKTEMDPDIRKGWTDYKNDQSEKRMSNAVKTTWMTSSNPTYRYMGRIKPYKETDSEAKKDATRDKFVGQQNTRDIRRNPPITVKEAVKKPKESVDAVDNMKVGIKGRKLLIDKKLKEENSDEAARQKRLAKLWGKDPKPKKKGKNAELMAGWADEIRHIKARRKEWDKEKK